MALNVAVVGAGIVGVTTAYELTALGHAVTVYERQASVAAEASFGSAGVVAAGLAAPWAAPGMRGALLRALAGREPSLRLGAGGALARLPWLARGWRACAPAVHDAGRRAMLQLALASRERLLELTRTLHLEYEQMPGCLVLLRSAADLARAQPALALLREQGVAHAVLDAAHGHAVEPGLHAGAPLHAAIHLPQDGVGNCRQFAQRLRIEAQQLGARFRLGAEVRRLVSGARPTLVTADGAEHGCDAVVVCAGVQAAPLLRTAGLRLPLRPVHGYALTAPLRLHDGESRPGPRAAVVDLHHGVLIARLGQRLRIAGVSEFAGRSAVLDPDALRWLYRVLDDWFPGAAQTREAVHWKGARPVLPDGRPVLGPSGVPGIWLNLGHGDHGWTLACGSARMLAERISGRAAPIDLGALGADRLR